MTFQRDSKIVTVFGGGGFVGRYACDALARAGVRLRVAQRDPREAYFLQPLGQVGQIGFVKADMRDAGSIERAVAGADAVVNLVGVFKGDLDRIHVAGPRLAAAAAKAGGASAFVHVSAIGGDPDSASNYGRTKGEGEAAVRAEFPDATVLRPSILFGAEDAMTNRFAQMATLPALPVVAGQSRFQPLHVRDLGRAVAMAALDPARFGGKTFDVAGPEVMTMREMVAQIAALAGQSPTLIDVPAPIASLISKFGFLPGAPLTGDQWLMLQKDNIADGSKPGLEALGITPSALSAVAGEWLGRFREGGRFAPSAVTGQPVA
jgi:NADH dehydrogenase